MDMNTVSNFLFQEWLNPLDDGVYNGGSVDYMDFFKFDRVGFLDAHQKLFDNGRCHFGEVTNRSYSGVQNVDVSSNSNFFCGKTDVANHQSNLHGVGNVGSFKIGGTGSEDGYAFAVFGEPRKGWEMAKIINLGYVWCIARAILRKKQKKTEKDQQDRKRKKKKPRYKKLIKEERGANKEVKS